ncbi:hypothetical protein B0H67DRAFT_591808 [Lasiosphaeris hirsuta]|uniref:Uncharacterized protein n=1 Tax=Lasiosphaeris hirsuta TaxID=260670 RepID=A0AA39ZW28_9PEZI|nr:hypothetical protein B0H67DRAFT_591808 [Lasiosphaeris hirsuta]
MAHFLNNRQSNPPDSSHRPPERRVWNLGAPAFLYPNTCPPCNSCLQHLVSTNLVSTGQRLTRLITAPTPSPTLALSTHDTAPVATPQTCWPSPGPQTGES